jgi:hypothetical protein
MRALEDFFARLIVANLAFVPHDYELPFESGGAGIRSRLIWTAVWFIVPLLGVVLIFGFPASGVLFQDYNQF